MYPGIKGWFPITAHLLGWSNDDQANTLLDNTVGGLELIMNFTDAKEREKVIDSGRAVGWSPPPWYEIEDCQWLNETIENGIIDVGQGLSLAVAVNKVWIPKFFTRGAQFYQDLKGSKGIGCYIRYKFYDTSKYTKWCVILLITSTHLSFNSYRDSVFSRPWFKEDKRI